MGIPPSLGTDGGLRRATDTHADEPRLRFMMGKFKQNIPSNAALPLNSDQDPNHHHETASQNKTRLKDSLTVIANVTHTTI